MSDIREPNNIGRARLEERLFEMELNLKRSKRRKLEIQWEIKKLEENEVATVKSMEALKEQIKGIPLED